MDFSWQSASRRPISCKISLDLSLNSAEIDRQNSSRSVSPTRATRASPSPIEPARRPSLRPKSATPFQTPSTPPIPTERPKLFFAIASTKPDEVARLLATGEASPNETVGPHDMHALTFAMENMAHGDPAMLPQMEEVVTTLLSYGADPTVLEDTSSKPNSSDQLRAGANPLVKFVIMHLIFASY